MSLFQLVEGTLPGNTFHNKTLKKLFLYWEKAIIYTLNVFSKLFIGVNKI